MRSSKLKEGLVLNSGQTQTRDTIRDLTAAWDSFSQTKAALRHIENHLEAVPTSTAVLDSVIDTKRRPPGNATRKVSRKDGRYMEETSTSTSSAKPSGRSRSRKEKSSRSPLRATTLESNIKKSSRVEFREPLASYRDVSGAPLYQSASQTEAQRLLYELNDGEARSKDERLSCMIYDRDTRDLHSREFDSTRSSAVDDTVVRYLNDRPSIEALQSSEALYKSEGQQWPEEERIMGYQGNDIGVLSLGSGFEVKSRSTRAVETSHSSSPSSSSHRLEMLKNRQHDAKLEKLKERIRKQWEQPEESVQRGWQISHAEQPLPASTEVTAPSTKVRKVTLAPPAPTYKGFNPIETKIRTPDGKVWREEEFHNVSRELYRDLSLQFAESSKGKEKSSKANREKVKPVRKVQVVTHSHGPDCKPSSNVINTASWREGQKLVNKLLGPTTKAGQGRRAESSDRTGRERKITSVGSGARADSDTRLVVPCKHKPQSSEQQGGKFQSESSLKKVEPSPSHPSEKEEQRSLANKDFLPVEIRGMLDDLQLESREGRSGQPENEEVEPKKLSRTARTSQSMSPAKRKPEKPSGGDEAQIPKKRHYDADVVRQYIVRQQEERKKKQNEEKKAQKEAAEQKNKRLQELYKKQKEAFARGKGLNEPTSAAVPVTMQPPLAKHFQETCSKLLLNKNMWEEQFHQPSVGGSQLNPGYQPSGESDKENKGQERPPSASSSSDMSLSDPQQPLSRNDLMEPSLLQPDRASPRVQPHHSQTADGGLFSQLLSLEQRARFHRDFESALSARKQDGTAKGPSLLQTQQFSSLTTQQDLLLKPTGHYKSKIDRIEALKATAASLSSRIESEAKKLAGAGINYGVGLNSEQDVGDDGRWAKPVSPPVRENSEDDFSARIQRMLGTSIGHTTYDDMLPGVSNLYDFKKFSEPRRPQTATANLGGQTILVRTQEVMLERSTRRSPEALEQEVQGFGQGNAAQLSPNSSVGSISEGPLLSEGSLSEEDPAHSEKGPIKMFDRLRENEFCAADRNTFRPIVEFQKEADRYSPLPVQSEAVKSKVPWEELAKGSPYSVINIFTKSYQMYGKGFGEKLDRSSPVLRPLLPAMSPVDPVSYEEDFLSPQDSDNLTSRKTMPESSIASSGSTVHAELPSRKSPYDHWQADVASQHSSGQRSPALSHSSASMRARGKAEGLEAGDRGARHSPLDEPRCMSGAGFSRGSLEGKRLEQGKTSPEENEPDTDGTLEDLSGHSGTSIPLEIGRSRRSAAASPSALSSSLVPQKSFQSSAAGLMPDEGKSYQHAPGFRPTTNAFTELNLGASRTSSSAAAAGPIQFSPSVLQHRMSAELFYLDAIEESVRQLADVERTRGISLAQQECVSLAQILKAQQQRHEQDLAQLKLKAEQEALETQRQLEESRQKAAQAHTESLQQLAQSQQEAAVTLQESASRMIAQQVEAARLTADTARQIKEMTELAQTQISEAVNMPAAPITTLLDQQRQHSTDFMRQLRGRAETERKNDISSPYLGKEKKSDSKRQYSPTFDSYSESSLSKNHDRSSSSSRQESLSLPSSKKKKKSTHHDNTDSYVEEEVHTAKDDSIHSDSVPSLPEEKDSTSIATEYSLKFDESMTEDEIEEKSFRSLLPSESHRRFNLEKKRSQREDSDEDLDQQNKALLAVKELNMPFSSGQDSFSRFTMEMVRQYMKEEEMRAAHQCSLLRLRQKALKEKAKAELAWLEHQKKRLRDKGEDDKMPPIRKRQRGLLLRLQQEQAEIKRLQEANKAARKERQLILKQQEEIERIRQTTMKLQEKLKSAGQDKSQHSSDTLEEAVKPTAASSPVQTDLETRSASPLSVSGSETSSIMQKLKKMRSHMDEKFLTKREQKLMQRRRHAEELLEWKHRLDAEEVEIRRIEKQALAAWDKELLRQKATKKEAGEGSPEQKETTSEAESPVPSRSHLNSESSVPEELPSPPADSAVSEAITHEKVFLPEHSPASDDGAYSQDFDSVTSPSKSSPPSKASPGLSKHDISKASPSISTQLKLPLKSRKVSGNWSDESQSMTHSVSETASSDQGDIESRIRALKEELRKRKSIVEQLKKEQRKREKERLKAQEASLLKQLESYDELIKKTQAELNKDLDISLTTKPQIKTPSSASEKLKLKHPPLQRSETTTKSWKSVTEPDRSKASLESIAENDSSPSVSERSLTTSIRKPTKLEIRPDDLSRTPSPILKSPLRSRSESADALDSLSPSSLSKDAPDGGKLIAASASKLEEVSGDESIVSSYRSDVQEELEHIKSEDSELDDGHSGKSESLLKLDIEKVAPAEDFSKRDIGSPDDQGKSQEEESSVVSEKNFIVQKDKDLDTKGEDERNEHSIGSVKSLKSENSIHSQNKSYIKEQSLSEAVSPGKESYSKDLDIAFWGNETSFKEIDKIPHVESTYRSDFELSYSNKASQKEHVNASSNDEIIEDLNVEPLSIQDSVHSEKLLELRYPTDNDEIQEHKPEPVVPSSSTLTPAVDDTSLLKDFKIGDRVLVSNVQPGTLRFKGYTNFANGYWAGVELDKPEGSNNGTYDGIEYFECKERHGIFAPPHKISCLTEHFELYADTTEEYSFFDDNLDRDHKQSSEAKEETQFEEQDTNEHREKSQHYKQSEASSNEDNLVRPMSQSIGGQTGTATNNLIQTIGDTAKSVELENFLVDTAKINDQFNSLLNGATEKVSNKVLEETADGRLTEELERVKSTEKLPSLVQDKPCTPLLDLLTREKDQLEAQLRTPSSEAEEALNEELQEEKVPKDQAERASSFANNLLEVFVKETVNQLQQIKKNRDEKIQISNQELQVEDLAESSSRVSHRPIEVNEESAAGLPSLSVDHDLEDDQEEVSSPDLCPRPVSPVFGASGQEELQKRLAELELSRELLDALGEDQDWFEEDFGLSSHKVQQQQKQTDQQKPQKAAEAEKVLPKPREEPYYAVPHTAVEVEGIVHVVAEELWTLKELGNDLQSVGVPADFFGNDIKGQDVESISKRVYKQAVFDLTKEIFQEIFADDPNMNQPLWMKPYRINSTYYRRVKNPNDLTEIKTFIANEVLKLFGLSKEQNQKTDWQKMMKFGRKKRDRVDHILVQELHEEEAQWVNYDEDELSVKMQLADGIFEALIKDTIEVLNQIQDRQGRLVPT
ncbi:centrosome-associated protein 350 isoform X2 [Latimeria chalumnae]|uniref:centrosome-associated protein 350 isoform X2 n=1 Tax=Latimeria chalumnae TaxID=7897 RepID=UPI00313A9198